MMVHLLLHEHKKADIRIRMIAEVKRAVEAVSMFFDYVFLPYLTFHNKIPNKETQIALQNAKHRRGLNAYKNLDEFKKSLRQ